MAKVTRRGSSVAGTGAEAGVRRSTSLPRVTRASSRTEALLSSSKVKSKVRAACSGRCARALATARRASSVESWRCLASRSSGSGPGRCPSVVMPASCTIRTGLSTLRRAQARDCLASSCGGRLVRCSSAEAASCRGTAGLIGASSGDSSAACVASLLAMRAWMPSKRCSLDSKGLVTLACSRSEGLASAGVVSSTAARSLAGPRPSARLRRVSGPSRPPRRVISAAAQTRACSGSAGSVERACNVCHAG